MLLGADTKRVLGEDRVTGLELNCGRVVQADFVVCAVGIRPQAQLARDAGLTVNRGIIVDDGLATSDPNDLRARRMRRASRRCLRPR